MEVQPCQKLRGQWRPQPGPYAGWVSYPQAYLGYCHPHHHPHPVAVQVLQQPAQADEKAPKQIIKVSD